MTRRVRDITGAIPQPLDDPNTVGELWQTDATGPSRMWSALDNVYSRGVFRLQPSEALVVEVPQIASVERAGESTPHHPARAASLGRPIIR